MHAAQIGCQVYSKHLWLQNFSMKLMLDPSRVHITVLVLQLTQLQDSLDHLLGLHLDRAPSGNRHRPHHRHLRPRQLFIGSLHFSLLWKCLCCRSLCCNCFMFLRSSTATQQCSVTEAFRLTIPFRHCSQFNWYDGCWCCACLRVVDGALCPSTRCWELASIAK